jgi:hypothetical protein
MIAYRMEFGVNGCIYFVQVLFFDGESCAENLGSDEFTIASCPAPEFGIECVRAGKRGSVGVHGFLLRKISGRLSQ